MNGTDEIVRELEKFSPDVIGLGGSIEDDRLETFEEKFGVKLPQEYKELIKRYNGIELFGNVLYGSDSSKQETLESVYEREHFQVQAPQPPYLVPFCADGGGNFYCFDTRYVSGEDIECPIVFWESNVLYDEEGPELVNESFFEWVMEIFIGWTLDLINYDGSPNGK